VADGGAGGSKAGPYYQKECQVLFARLNELIVSYVNLMVRTAPLSLLSVGTVVRGLRKNSTIAIKNQKPMKNMAVLASPFSPRTTKDKKSFCLHKNTP